MKKFLLLTMALSVVITGVLIGAAVVKTVNTWERYQELRQAREDRIAVEALRASQLHPTSYGRGAPDGVSVPSPHSTLTVVGSTPERVMTVETDTLKDEGHSVKSMLALTLYTSLQPDENGKLVVKGYVTRVFVDCLKRSLKVGPIHLLDEHAKEIGMNPGSDGYDHISPGTPGAVVLMLACHEDASAEIGT